MAGKPPKKKPIEQYEHKDKERLNNPPVGLVDAHSDNGGLRKKKYAYDPHLDPQLQWAGKAEHTAFEVPTVSLHVHERIDRGRSLKLSRKKKLSRSFPSLRRRRSPSVRPSSFTSTRRTGRTAWLQATACWL